MTDPLLPAREVKKELGVKADITLNRWVKEGILPEPKRIRNRKYWRKSVVDRVKEMTSDPYNMPKPPKRKKPAS